MKLSEAIRLGAMLKPQTRGTFDNGKATCALGAAYEANPVQRTGRIVTGPLDIFGTTPFRGGRVEPGTIVEVVPSPYEWHDVMWVRHACPACAHTDTGNRLIPHLNDRHKWTREQIAEWVATIEAQHEVQQPAPALAAQTA